MDNSFITTLCNAEDAVDPDVNYYQGLAGDGKLIDNLGTSSGSRYVQLYNG